MIAEIFIVTFKRDFGYLQHCLRSIQKFFPGPSVHLLVPESDQADALMVADLAHCPVKVSGFEEWPKQGMIHHMYQIMTADKWCPAADIIIHFDADCIFTEPVTIETYAPNEKPILRYESYEHIGKRHPQVFDKWKEACEKCLPFPCPNETMRCHPLVYHRSTYWMARQLMQEKTQMRVEEYIKKQQNEFPQTFCEFNTLGAVAMEFFPKLYTCIEQKSDKVDPPNHVIQFWSHGPIGNLQDIWLDGKIERLVPHAKIHEILGPIVETNAQG